MFVHVFFGRKFMSESKNYQVFIEEGNQMFFFLLRAANGLDKQTAIKIIFMFVFSKIP